MPKDYPIGYGRPPKHRQFQPGQSGNRKGRPKGSKNFGTLLKEALNKQVTVKEGGKKRRITKAQAMAETLVNDAIKGDNQARRAFIWIARLTGELQTAPENKLRAGGVLRLGPKLSREEWETLAAEQQRKYRESTTSHVKKPEPNDPNKLD